MAWLARDGSEVNAERLSLPLIAELDSAIQREEVELTRATIIGHIQRGGSPTCKDRVYASAMGSLAVDLLAQGYSNRVVAYKNGEFTHFDIGEALNMKKDISEFLFDMQKKLSR